MIHTDLHHTRNALRWLFSECSLSHFASSRLPAMELEGLLERLENRDTPALTGFIDKLFERLELKAPQWSETIEHEELPVIALIPDGGIAVIVALQSDGSWHSETQKGITNQSYFPHGTLFSTIKYNRTDKTKSSATRMFIDIAKRQKPILIYAAIASLSINILALGTSFYSMQVYDRVIPTQGISTLIALSIGVFVAIFLEMILKLSRSSILDHASKNMDIAYSHDIFSRFLTIRADALPKSVGTLSGQLQSYGAVRSFISSASLYLIVDFPFSIIFLGVIILISGWTMGLIALVFLLIAILSGLFFKGKIEALSKSSSMASHKKLGLLVETVENAENVKASGAGWNILSRWNALSEDAIYDDIEIRHYSELSTYMTAFFQQISYVALVATGAYLVSTTDTLTMGGLIAVTILSGRILSPIAMLPNLLVQWGRTKIAISDLDRVYNLPIDNEGIERPLSPVIIAPKIECFNVKFVYSTESAPISIPKLLIKPGERVAILGSIGSGKSTLLKMLSGLYMPTEGKIQLGNIDIQLLSPHRIQETIGYLPQTIKLISGTLRDNLLMGMIGINDETILEIATQTGLIHLINTLPKGLDTPVPEGGESVSGGQKQLIALTRLVLRTPKLWLLDEPTASMDDGNEKLIIQLLHQKIAPDHTLIVVTHKAALLGLVNRIIVMTPQGIVMDGPRDSVLQQLSARSPSQSQGNV